MLHNILHLHVYVHVLYAWFGYNGLIKAFGIIATPLGESRSLAVKRFESLERSLRAGARFEEFADAIREYIDQDHAEPVPVKEFGKSSNQMYYCTSQCTWLGRKRAQLAGFE